MIFHVEQDLDGNAVTFGLGTSPGPDWLKDVVPTLGLRLKVHNALHYVPCTPLIQRSVEFACTCHNFLQTSFLSLGMRVIYHEVQC